MKCLGCGTEVYVNELHRDEEQLRELADGGGTEHTPERCRTTSGVNRLIEAAREALCGMPGGARPSSLSRGSDDPREVLSVPASRHAPLRPRRGRAMSADRDRRAAEEWLDANDGPAVPPRSAVDSLAAFRAAARAEGAAEAIEACCAAAEALREGPTTPTIGALVATMRRLTPDPDLVAVRRGGEERT